MVMKKCPKCGNRYRPDVEVCPNDGTKLPGGPPGDAPPPSAGLPDSSVPTSAPPPGKRPPTSSRDEAAKRPRPASSPNEPAAFYDEPGGLTEKSSVGSWIFALLACLLMFGGFYWARGHLLGGGPEGAAEEVAAEEETGGEKSRKRRRGKRKRKRTAKPGEERSYEDYDWTQDFQVDDRTFGDVLSEPEHVEEEYVEVVQPEPYDPTPAEYQPQGRYRPTARYAEPGTDDQVVTIDLQGGGSGPLKAAQIERVLSVRKLAPCYDPWVSKIPQMKGRVWMDFVVAPDGHVSKVEITRSQLRSKVVEKCLVRRARNFRFPASDGRSTRFDTHFDFTNR